jgi:hypothetical protein
MARTQPTAHGAHLTSSASDFFIRSFAIETTSLGKKAWLCLSDASAHNDTAHAAPNKESGKPKAESRKRKAESGKPKASKSDWLFGRYQPNRLLLTRAEILRLLEGEKIVVLVFPKPSSMLSMQSKAVNSKVAFFWKKQSWE